MSRREGSGLWLRRRAPAEGEGLSSNGQAASPLAASALGRCLRRHAWRALSFTPLAAMPTSGSVASCGAGRPAQAPPVVAGGGEASGSAVEGGGARWREQMGRHQAQGRRHGGRAGAPHPGAGRGTWFAWRRARAATQLCWLRRRPAARQGARCLRLPRRLRRLGGRVKRCLAAAVAASGGAVRARATAPSALAVCAAGWLPRRRWTSRTSGAT